MNDTVYFTNNGSFDVTAMLTFGVSAKRDDTAIGYFGTGFKYAVAIILRVGGFISVRTTTNDGANETFDFSVIKRIIRDQEFDVVYVSHNGGEPREAGFTTRLGINWEPWMAFRELYCNAKDEGGDATTSESEADTVITVKSKEIAQALQNKDLYFITGAPICEHEAADIYDKRGDYLYYRGIAVSEIDSEFTYNIKSFISLTEDRTVKDQWYVRWAITRAVQACEVPRIIRKIVTNGERYEHKAGFNSDCFTSPCFLEQCRMMLDSSEGISDAAMKLLREKDCRIGDYNEFSLTKVQELSYKRAVQFLSGIGINVDRFPVRFVEGLGKGVMGRALDGVILISPIAFNMGVKQLASTLMEEWVHIVTGAQDFDRTMQSWLFDKILSLAEEINQDPL